MNEKGKVVGRDEDVAADPDDNAETDVATWDVEKHPSELLVAVVDNMARGEKSCSAVAAMSLVEKQVWEIVSRDSWSKVKETEHFRFDQRTVAAVMDS